MADIFTNPNPEMYIPIELETKIPDIELRSFERGLDLARAKLSLERRLIDDKSFEFKGVTGTQASLPVSDIDSSSRSNFILALRKLGFNLDESTLSANYVATGEPTGKKVRIRLRQDGDKCFLTVKFKTDRSKEMADQGIKQREEYDIQINSIPDLEIFFTELGYACAFQKQKYRTSYEVSIDGEAVKVELNESPDPRVKPWLEIEGRTERSIRTTAELLGYNNTDFYNGSDNDLYRQAGLTPDELKSLKFPSKT